MLGGGVRLWRVGGIVEWRRGVDGRVGCWRAE